VNVTTDVATANYQKLPLADPRPTLEASVQRSQPSGGQYVLGLLLDHNARCHRHWESWLREVERDPSYSQRICRKKYPRLWDNLLRSRSCPVSCLQVLALIAPSRQVSTPSLGLRLNGYHENPHNFFFCVRCEPSSSESAKRLNLKRGNFRCDVKSVLIQKKRRGRWVCKQ